ncbi:DUF4199 domain-containing protein [Rufibacter sp. LB8]|uniref:DUF4199 domain-containing protein n=1 Tax=Rufibacter sp. LB8 TaxID=2777781 RepID=UPI00178C1936|nr:DUF4199 domain-containing protein [Rufibacter sp. LB8]
MNEQQTTTPSATGLRYGLLTGLVLVIFTAILYVTDMAGNKLVASLGWLILIGGIVMAYQYFKRANNGFMSYGQGLGIGTILGAVVGLLGGIFAAIYTSMIDNSIMTREMDKQIEEMEARGLSEEQIEQAMEMANMFTGPVMVVVITLITYIIGAFILSLIIAAIMKRSQPEFE